MPNIKPVAIETASAEQKKVLEGIKARLGMLPNIYATLAHSPSTLGSMLAYSSGLKKGALSPREIESIALAVAQKNQCDYCLAAHTVMGKGAGLLPAEMLDVRQGRSADKKMDALVKLAVELTDSQGLPSKVTVRNFYQAGYDDGALVEVIAWVAYNIFTNYINHVAGTDIDFPAAPPLT
jgi:uncharacterized peroxidase-related enzyme